ncbi:MAG: IS66 family insertion sequence element accessory protein TnpA, partial [Myxococcales bacterium]
MARRLLVLPMGRERREVWRKRVERWARSGLTAEEFSRETGVRVGTLRFWKWRFGAE